jgi:hypothetical protein
VCHILTDMQPSIIVWDLETVADPGAEVCKSPFNVELLQALKGRSGNWAARIPPKRLESPGLLQWMKVLRSDSRLGTLSRSFNGR